MQISNKLGLPEPLVDAVRNDDYDPGRPVFASVTRLIAPPQQTALVEAHDEEIEEDVSDRIWALFGKSVHAVLETAGDEYALREERYYATLDNGYTISGKFDRLAAFYLPTVGHVLQDYKVTSAWSHVFEKGVPKKEWQQQLNSLQWILGQNAMGVDRLEIVAIFRDWSKREAQKNPDYPQTQVMVYEIPIWGRAATEAWLYDRCHALEQARAATEVNAGVALPECSDEERWVRGEKWAVMKEGRKSAVRVFNSEPEAQTFIDNTEADVRKHYVEHRPGTAVRCADYCSAAPFCPQYQAEVSQELEEEFG